MATPGAGSMNSGPSPGMQASRYYLVLTYPEGQYDGEYVEGKKVDEPVPHELRLIATRLLNTWQLVELTLCCYKDGHGVFTYPNGDRYEGEWRRDQLWGTGTFTWANGDRYQVHLTQPAPLLNGSLNE